MLWGQYETECGRGWPYCIRKLYHTLILHWTFPEETFWAIQTLALILLQEEIRGRARLLLCFPCWSDLRSWREWLHTRAWLTLPRFGKSNKLKQLYRRSLLFTGLDYSCLVWLISKLWPWGHDLVLVGIEVWPGVSWPSFPLLSP